jgi:hypothetical protein
VDNILDLLCRILHPALHLSACITDLGLQLVDLARDIVAFLVYFFTDLI